MKKVHIIFKTHLDLGFTDYANNIVELYNKRFIPEAIKLAKSVNTPTTKKFIWTTGSWIIKNALDTADNSIKQMLIDALKNGDIAVHGLPFTTHSELLDEDTFLYGLEIAKELSEYTNQSIIAAKMTDVPGHSKAIIPLLNRFGIKLLHIGVNEGSAVPEVPAAFVWKHNGAEVVVLYQASYGDVYKNEHMDDILYFAHSADNMGPLNREELDKLYAKLGKEYPDYEITASTLDDYANALIKAKEKLPIIEQEIGDSWIHGAATDPYKAAALRELIELKNQWLIDKTLIRGSNEYNNLAQNILLLAEHTCGLDVKKYLSDVGIYLKTDFLHMRKADSPKLNLCPKGLRDKLAVLYYRHKNIFKQGSYSAMEKSWQEQREYISNAIVGLSPSHKDEARAKLSKLIPSHGLKLPSSKRIKADQIITIGDYSFSFNTYGALANLSYKNTKITENNTDSFIDYRSYSSADYNFWRDNYSRNYNYFWVRADFGRPMLRYLHKKYPFGNFNYVADSIEYKETEKNIEVLVKLSAQKELSEYLGAPRTIQTLYTFCKKEISIDFEIIWLDKDISRLPESISANFAFIADKDSLKYKKIGSIINPYSIVKYGNRNIAAVEEVHLNISNLPYILKNYHSPIVSIGKVDILMFDNKYKDASNGLSFNLHNNIWGTNFPLWYGDNAYFKFKLCLQK